MTWNGRDLNVSEGRIWKRHQGMCKSVTKKGSERDKSMTCVKHGQDDRMTKTQATIPTVEDKFVHVPMICFHKLMLCKCRSENDKN